MLFDWTEPGQHKPGLEFVEWLKHKPTRRRARMRQGESRFIEPLTSPDQEIQINRTAGHSLLTLAAALELEIE